MYLVGCAADGPGEPAGNRGDQTAENYGARQGDDKDHNRAAAQEAICDPLKDLFHFPERIVELAGGEYTFKHIHNDNAYAASKLAADDAYAYNINNMAAPPPQAGFSYSGKRLLLLVFFLLFLYVVVPRLGNFSESLHALEHARWEYILIACVLVIVTYCLAAGTYWLIALKPLRYWRTLAVQAAGAFANRLLPAGLGGFTLNVQYLRHHRHTGVEAVLVAGANNLLGVLGHLLLLGIAALMAGGAILASFTFPDIPGAWLIGTVLLGITAVGLMAFKTSRSLIYKTTSQLLKYVAAYRRRSRRLLLGLLCTMTLTACYALILYMSALSLGAELTLLQIFMVFTVGMIATAATPTPGGLVGAEAGLTTGLIAYGLEGSLALAIALLYRFLTYWLPLLPGFVVFVLARRSYS